jgi:hypothetical protein
VRKSIVSACGGLVLAAINSLASAETVDAKLLGMLKANGSITQAQYEELSADLAKEEKAEKAESRDTASKEDLTALQQKLAWAANTVVSGDIRLRQEQVTVEDRSPEQTANRQRYRARLGIVSQVSPTVEAGMRIASGNNDDQRSTNQDFNNYFKKKDVWLDRAYINWHPENVPGLKLWGGRMPQPWVKVAESELVWDNDVNPEGFAAQYNKKFGDTNVFGSGGYFTVKDNVTGFGPDFSNDLKLYYAQVGANLYPFKDYKLTIGTSVFHYYKDSFSTPGSPGAAPASAPAYTAVQLEANGNTSTQFQLYEGFAQLDIIGLPLPLSLYSQYVHNANANGPQSDKDAGYMVGFITRVWDIGINYQYRDVERNAVVGAFTDSDFGGGFTASRGSKLQLNYNIAKNFQFVTTYFLTESNASNPGHPGSDTNTWQIDLIASF